MAANLIYLYAILAVLGILSLLVSSPPNRSLIWLGVFFSVYWTLVHLPVFGLDRFSLPLLPFLTIYAAVGLSAVLDFDS